MSRLWYVWPESANALHRVPADCPQEVAVLVAWCLDGDPQARPTATQVIDELRKMRGEHSRGVDSGVDSGSVDVTVGGKLTQAVGSGAAKEEGYSTSKSGNSGALQND